MNKTIWALAFVVLACGVSFAMENATATEVTQSGYDGETTAGNVTIEGGNISETDLGINASTEKWAGFYGTVTGQLVLAEAASSPYMYSWTYAGAGGEVCVSTNDNYVWSTLAPVVAGTIDAAWSFLTTDTDSETATMIETGNVNVSLQSVDSIAVTTEGATTWQTVALRDGVGTAKDNLAFCVNITAAGTDFAGNAADYQLMAPTDQAAGATEAYFFYLELI